MSVLIHSTDFFLVFQLPLLWKTVSHVIEQYEESLYNWSVNCFLFMTRKSSFKLEEYNMKYRTIYFVIGWCIYCHLLFGLVWFFSETGLLLFLFKAHQIVSLALTFEFFLSQNVCSRKGRLGQAFRAQINFFGTTSTYIETLHCKLQRYIIFPSKNKIQGCRVLKALSSGWNTILFFKLSSVTFYNVYIYLSIIGFLIWVGDL